jgi:hypothetical protein
MPLPVVRGNAMNLNCGHYMTVGHS